MKKHNCLILAHVKQPYYQFHIDAFQAYFESIEIFYYTDFFSNHGLRSTEQEIKKIIKSKLIDIVIIWQWPTFYGLTLEFLSSLRTNTFTLLWLFDDDVFFHSHGKYNAQVVDLVITTDYFGKLMYEQLQISSLYYLSAYDKELYRKKELKKEFDVSFVGGLSKADRKEYIEFLEQHGINVAVFGDGAGTGYVSDEEMIDIFNKSKINLNFTKIAYWIDMYEDNPLISRVRQNKGRIIEIGLSGSFCLSEEAPSLQYIVDLENHLDTFAGKEELLQKIQYYLSHESERGRKAEAFYNFCLNTYEQNVYFELLFDQIYQKLIDKQNHGYKKFKAIEKSYYYKRRESSFFFRYAMKMIIKKKNLSAGYEMLQEAFKYGVIHFIKASWYALNHCKHEKMGMAE